MPFVPHQDSVENQRLQEDLTHQRHWKKWGTYLSERQWGTVREDYSADGNCWDYFPHDHARSRAYRWGEDGLLGFCDKQSILCFSPVLWNGKDPILKERLFGLNSREGNHGEDVKECYYYLANTPTHSYAKALYKYPQAEFPYARLVEENRRRGKNDPEFELIDTGIFDDHRYFDVFVEYAKASPDDILIKITAVNRGPESAPLHLLPTIWFRNTWSWGRLGEGYWPKAALLSSGKDGITVDHPVLGKMVLKTECSPELGDPRLLFTENETNFERLFNLSNDSPYVKDGFHEAVIHGRREKANSQDHGTKAACYYALQIPPGGQKTIRLRLTALTEAKPGACGLEFDQIMEIRQKECQDFYNTQVPQTLSAAEKTISQQAYAGLLWSKQYYLYKVKEWLEGDPHQPPPPAGREEGRNHEWTHLGAEEVLSMPDKWEYPWFAAWDLAFHMVPFSRIDPEFAKHQLVLLLREWYMHPNGKIPAYEFAFSDVNPPLHAWAAWRVYKMTAPEGKRDRTFLSRVFQKLLLNFTWWVNQKDERGNNLFSGGFLGLDNIGAFDRSEILSNGSLLEQADGTALMAFYCGTMLSIALELARENPATEDMATKFFEHYIGIVDALNSIGGTGLWDEEDGFYYDQLSCEGKPIPMKVRSLVGLAPLLAVEVLEDETLRALPDFYKRMNWFLANRKDLLQNISYLESVESEGKLQRLLAVPSRNRLERVLKYVLDENEFLSPYGLRSVSKVHRDHPYVLWLDGNKKEVDYEPGESTTGLFGGNSNWRGPVWFPYNFMLVEALERYFRFYGDSLKVECPTGSGKRMNLLEVSRFLADRLISLFIPDEKGNRPCDGGDPRYATDPDWKDLIQFNEYFHGDTGKGLGASHQTGWTALVAKLLEGRAP